MPPLEPKSPLHPGMPAAALDAWLAKHQLSSWRGLPISFLVGRVSRSEKDWVTSPLAQERTLGDVLTATPRDSLTGLGSTEALVAVQLAAIAYLEDRRRSAERATAQEPAHLLLLSQPVMDSTLQPLQDRLLRLRAEVRNTTAAREATSVAPQIFSIDVEKRLVTVEEDVFANCGRHDRPKIALSLDPEGPEGPEGQEPPIRCDCPAGANGRCPIGLGAIDGVLGVLAGRGSESARTKIREALAGGPWLAALEAIDHALGTGTAPANDQAVESDAAPKRLAWRCTFAPNGTPELALVSEHEHPRTGKVSFKPERVADLRHGRFPLALPADLEVARTLPLESYSYRSQTDQLLLRRALAQLIGHPRVYSGRTGTCKLAVRRSELALHLRSTPTHGLRLELTVGGLAVDADRLHRLVKEVQPGEDLTLRDESASRADLVATHPDLAPLLVALMSAGPVQAPASVPAWLVRVAALERVVKVEVDPALGGESVRAVVTPFVRLIVLTGHRLAARLLIRPLAGGAIYPPGQGPEDVYGDRGTEPIFVHRDLEAERAAAIALIGRLDDQPSADAAPLVSRPDDDWSWEFETTEESLEFLARLQSLDPPVACEWLGPASLRLTRPATAHDLSLCVASKRDWFGLKGELVLDGVHVAVSALLAAVRDGRRFIPADGGALIQLDAALREALSALANVTGAKDSLSAPQMPLVERLQQLGTAVDVPKAWADIARRARAAIGLVPTLPVGLKATLREYQLAGFAWMARLAQWSPGCCLADDMGLGKTIQSLALLLHRAALGPALVVAPTSLGFNWAREAARFAQHPPCTSSPTGPPIARRCSVKWAPTTSSSPLTISWCATPSSWPGGHLQPSSSTRRMR